MRMRVRVVGAGIIGLAAALRLREVGHDVDVVAADRPGETTSAVAAALWYPYRAFPEAEVTRWAAQGFRALREFSANPASGVLMRTGREIFRRPVPDPWWIEAVPHLERVAAPDLPPGYVDGFELTVPVADMAVHLGWLTDRLKATGVPVRIERLRTLERAHDGVDVVVNCTGLGARELARDTTVRAIRGQIVVVGQVGVDRWLLDEDDPTEFTYVVPRQDTVVLGGTAEVDDESGEIRPATAEAILLRTAALVPALSEARILAHRVGVRPARPAVRLEEDDSLGARTVHCYGHGGAGVTLAYGCAEDIVRLVG